MGLLKTLKSFCTKDQILLIKYLYFLICQLKIIITMLLSDQASVHPGYCGHESESSDTANSPLALSGHQMPISLLPELCCPGYRGVRLTGLFPVALHLLSQKEPAWSWHKTSQHTHRRPHWTSHVTFVLLPLPTQGHSLHRLSLGLWDIPLL